MTSFSQVLRTLKADVVNRPRFAKIVEDIRNGRAIGDRLVAWLSNEAKCDAPTQWAYLAGLQDVLLFEEGLYPSGLAHEIICRQKDRIGEYGLKSFRLSEKQVRVIVNDLARFAEAEAAADAALTVCDAALAATEAAKAAEVESPAVVAPAPAPATVEAARAALNAIAATIPLAEQLDHPALVAARQRLWQAEEDATPVGTTEEWALGL